MEPPLRHLPLAGPQALVLLSTASWMRLTATLLRVLCVLTGVGLLADFAVLGLAAFGAVIPLLGVAYITARQSASLAYAADHLERIVHSDDGDQQHLYHAFDALRIAFRAELVLAAGVAAGLAWVVGGWGE